MRHRYPPVLFCGNQYFTGADRLSSKGLSSSIYTLAGVLLVAVFVLFLFVTQSENTAENLRTLAASDKSFNSEIQLRRLFTTSFPVPREDNIDMVTAISYGCRYGDPSQSHAYKVSEPEDTYVETERFLSSYLNETLRFNYRLIAECRQNDNIVVGEEVPSSTDRVISSVLEIPMPDGNRTEVILKRW